MRETEGQTGLTHPLQEYIRPSAAQTSNCPGCGNGTAAQSILRAFQKLSLSLDEFVFVSGIGCSAWIPSPFFYADVLHTTHGRAIAFATGIKLSRPDRRVMVISGDGDLTAIGGNHLIHAARRNIDMIVVCINNGIYGMTGGQMAPTTPLGLKTQTTPFGNIEQAFDISRLAEAAGASFVARWTTYHPRQLTRTVMKALGRKGFSLIEVVSQCPVQLGKKSRIGSATEMLEDYRKRSVSVSKAREMHAADLKDRIVVGELTDNEKPSLTEELAALRSGLSGQGSGERED
jgi:2-oxoglutarate ferredoxin oxidoreductase subunit beta